MCRSQTLEQVAVKLKLLWRPKDVRDARAMGHMLRKAVNRDWNYPSRKKCVAAIKAVDTGLPKSSGEYMIPHQSLMSECDLQNLEFPVMLWYKHPFLCPHSFMKCVLSSITCCSYET